jgi:hypothetical protein
MGADPQTKICRTMKCKRIKRAENKTDVNSGCNDLSGKIGQFKNGMSRDLPKRVFE